MYTDIKYHGVYNKLRIGRRKRIRKRKKKETGTTSHHSIYSKLKNSCFVLCCLFEASTRVAIEIAQVSTCELPEKFR